ncbi:hypothetical protein [Mycobacterium canetti]|uniref:hypothetical protein n=1 Tax=Mycobacterium canetti TaxID=78331 RepID=UPI0005C5CD71|nr:hypothetical protein [Mycobacterium canetti]
MAEVVGGGPQDEVPEADAVEQAHAVDFDDEAGLDTAYLSGGAGDRDASEADVVDQAFVVPVADDEEIDR